MVVRQVTDVHRSNPGFLTMLVADTLGRVRIAVRPGSVRVDPTERATIVDDREYFRGAMRGGVPFLSSGFRGRTLGSDPTAAVSAPLHTVDGHRIGIIEGSLDLALVQGEAVHESLSGIGRPPARLVLLDLHWYEHAAGVVDAAARIRRARCVKGAGSRPRRRARSARNSFARSM